MGDFENPDLHASAVQTVRINYFAAITAVWKKTGFGQPDRYHAPEPHFFVSSPALIELLAIRPGYQKIIVRPPVMSIAGLASIFFKRQLCDLFASLVERGAYGHVKSTSIPPYQPRSQSGERRFACLWNRLDAACLLAVSGHGCPLLFRGALRQAPNF